MKGYKYRFNLHLHYFDTGYGRLSIVKYFWLIAAGGSILSGIDYIYAMYAGIVYMVVCYLFGWAWFRFGWFEAQIEVTNQFNLFVKETRKFIKA